MDPTDGVVLPLQFSRDRGESPIPARTLQYRATTGRVSRLRAGVFVEPEEFAAAGRRRRELARIAAVVATRRGRVVLSHESAAAVWGLPRIGPPPEFVDLLDVRGTRPRSMNGVMWRRTRFDPAEIVEVNGFLVTGLLQTVVDLACDRAFVNAVVALDAATGAFLRADGFIMSRGVEPAAVERRLGELGRRGGVRGARTALEFTDARAESVGESVSRAQMHLLGFPAPVLQQEFDRSDGGVDRVDFDWPDHGVFGEFDGDLKYLDPRYRGGRTAEQVVLDEKKRDQRIARRHRRHGVHWDWRAATHPRELAAALEDAGVPRRRASHRAS